MKPSIYNQFVDDGDKVIVFNGITEKFFEIKSTHLPVYKDLLSNCHLYGDEVKPFINRMYDEGFVVEDDMDELVRLEKKNDYMVKGGSILSHDPPYLSV